MCDEHGKMLDKGNHKHKCDGKLTGDFNKHENKPKIKHASKSFKMSHELDVKNEKRPGSTKSGI